MWSNWKNDGCPEFKKPEGGKASTGGTGNSTGKQNGKSEEVKLFSITNSLFSFFNKRRQTGCNQRSRRKEICSICITYQFCLHTLSCYSESILQWLFLDILFLTVIESNVKRQSSLQHTCSLICSILMQFVCRYCSA